MKKILAYLIVFCWPLAGFAATTNGTDEPGRDGKDRKSIEIGIGADMHNLNRIGFHDYRSTPDGDRYGIRIRNAMFGGNVYVARELNRWFYIDLQGTVGAARALDISNPSREKSKLFAMVGPGVQFRLTPLFKVKYVEPYFRVGVNYYYKDFLVVRSGRFENFEGNFLEWSQTDSFNDNVDSRRHFFPLSFGFGVNSWFNDRVGFGIQGDYLASFGSRGLQFPRVTARIMIRFGESKKPKQEPEIRYVENVVIREVPKEVEKIVERVVIEKEKVSDALILLFSDINFEFDKDVLTADSGKRLDDAAAILKEMPDYKFLITGYTDSRGAAEYNKSLSERRSDAVMRALAERGVPLDMLKSRGVGKNAASMSPGETDTAREGDRKVTIEIIQNMEYWNKLP